MRDIILAKKGIRNLRDTYSEDQFFSCKFDTVIEDIDGQVEEWLNGKAKKLFSGINRSELESQCVYILGSENEIVENIDTNRNETDIQNDIDKHSVEENRIIFNNPISMPISNSLVNNIENEHENKKYNINTEDQNSDDNAQYYGNVFDIDGE